MQDLTPLFSYLFDHSVLLKKEEINDFNKFKIQGNATAWSNRADFTPEFLRGRHIRIPCTIMAVIPFVIY
jgi:hypothetical protein